MASIEPIKKQLIASKEKNDVDHEFNFPFKPYDIQLKLMKTAYDTFESRKFALLESPTGTGKSLSLICSALTWLRDHQTTTKQNLESRAHQLTEQIQELKQEEDASGDWLTSQTKRQDVARELEGIRKELERIAKFKQRTETRRRAKLHGVPLEDYSSFSEGKIDDTRQTSTSNSCLIASQESNHEDDEADLEKRVKEDCEDHVRPKIFYASRTHSQLSQFINEIKRTKFADLVDGPAVKVAPIASRANLCVNPDVIKLKEPSAINERCSELQRESSADKRCPFAKLKQVSMLKEDILTYVQDIEDLVRKGKSMGSCAYYAARMAIPEAEVVVLPYNNLLHCDTRKASSLDLKDNIVIVDEAHNILETISSIHSSPINGQQLIGSHTILSRYYHKFHNRMSPKNAEMIKTIVQCLTALINYLNDTRRHLEEYDGPKANSTDGNISNDKKDVLKPASDNLTCTQEEFMVDVSKFIGAAKIDRFNVFKIVDYFGRSQLARKLLGFYKQDNTFDLNLELHGLDKVNSSQIVGNEPAGKKRKKLVENRESTIVNKWEQTSLKYLVENNPSLVKQDICMTSYPIYTLVEFMKSLTNLAHDGKVLTVHVGGHILKSQLKFILLNPSSQFTQMVEEARSIVLAGGTMQPFSEFVDLLFEPLGVNRDRLSLFSCGHVIREEQICVTTLSCGPNGRPIELSYKTRSSFDTVDEIGQSILSIASVAPAGMVCFLPSYDYEQFCFNRWSKIGIIRTIETKYKQVFREPRQTAHLKPVLDEYSRVVRKSDCSGRGAMLMCVVGGKMSEGINFNDELGRCIVMIGLPYANVKSGELQQKMAYYDRNCKRISSTVGAQLSSGQQYYENLCIKGINQSIGRAIRHRNDYAGIVLLDRRYTQKSSIKNGLPGWIRSSLVEQDRFETFSTRLKNFYSNMIAKQQLTKSN